MKKIILLTLLALITLCSAEELKVTTLETKQVNYENGNIAATTFRVVCINGYKWLQYGTENGSISHRYDIENGSISQMFQNDRMNGYTQAIPCKN